MSLPTIPTRSLIFDSVDGDELLYLEPNRRLGEDRGATLVVQWDTERATHFELTPGQRRALGVALLREGPETGCEHGTCYDEVGAWEGCQVEDPAVVEHRMEGAFD